MTELSKGVRRGYAVYEKVKSDLLDGRYSVGDRLSVEQIGTECGVSKQPVMEAMRLLSADNLVTIIPQVGCRVAGYSRLEITDFLAAFAQMEGSMAAHAAERRTPDQLEVLEELLDEMNRARGAQKARAATTRLVNRKIHAAIHEMAGAPLLADLSRRMWDLRDFLVRASLINERGQMIAQFDSDHRRITEAIAAQNSSLARMEMEHHILGLVTFIDRESPSS